MSIPAAAPFDRATARALFLLGAAYFIQATAALAVVGAFEPVRNTWHLTATSTALLVTAFGGTFALSAPVLQMLVGGWHRRTQILTGLSAMAAGAFAFGFAPSLPLLVAARVAMGLGAALISPVLSALATSLAAPAQRGRALATILTGLSISAVVGVPSSAWIAQTLGARGLFLVIGAVSLAVAYAIGAAITDRTPGERVSPRTALALLSRRATLSGLAVIFLLTAGIFATYTMIVPILRQVYGASPRVASTGLLVYGVAGLIGNLFVRQASARWSAEALLRTAMVTLAAVFAALLFLPATLIVVFAALVVWPFVTDMVWPSQQRRIIELEPNFRGLALALTASFMFSGIAAGSALGGAVYPHVGVAGTLLSSIVLVLASLGALRYSERARRRMPASAPAPAKRAGIPGSASANQARSAISQAMHPSPAVG